MSHSRSVELVCHDHTRLAGNLWPSRFASRASIVINPATGVAARYYHRYAAFLATHGFDVLTYDYRGIGQSRPTDLRTCGYRWRDWGELDFDAALRFMHAQAPSTPIAVVGHSIGGFLLGLAPNGALVDRALTVGANMPGGATMPSSEGLLYF